MANVATDAATTVANPPSTQSVTLVTPQDPSPPHDLMVNVSVISSWAIAIAGIVGLVTMIYKWIVRDLKKDMDMLRHKIGNVAQKLDALEHVRNTDNERIIKVEVGLVTIEKRFDTLEETIRNNHETMMREFRSAITRTA